MKRYTVFFMLGGRYSTTIIDSEESITDALVEFENEYSYDEIVGIMETN